MTDVIQILQDSCLEHHCGRSRSFQVFMSLWLLSLAEFDDADVPDVFGHLHPRLDSLNLLSTALRRRPEDVEAMVQSYPVKAQKHGDCQMVEVRLSLIAEMPGYDISQMLLLYICRNPSLYNVEPDWSQGFGLAMCRTWSTLIHILSIYSRIEGYCRLYKLQFHDW